MLISELIFIRFAEGSAATSEPIAEQGTAGTDIKR
jgi:hypothetical protein